MLDCDSGLVRKCMQQCLKFIWSKVLFFRPIIDGCKGNRFIFNFDIRNYPGSATLAFYWKC